MSAEAAANLGLDEASKKDLQEFLEIEQSKAQQRMKVLQMTDMCWNKCIQNQPGNRFSRSEEGCIMNCVDRFIDSSIFIVNKLQNQSQH